MLEGEWNREVFKHNKDLADGVIVHSERFSERFARDHGISQERTAPFFRGVFQDCLTGKADLREEIDAVIEKAKGMGRVALIYLESPANPTNAAAAMDDACRRP